MCWSSVLPGFNSRLFPQNPSGASKEWLLGRRGSGRGLSCRCQSLRASSWVSASELPVSIP